MTCNATVYIDGSGSVGSLHFSMLEVASIYQDAGWQVFEFSSKVRPFDRKCGLMSEGTSVEKLEKFIHDQHLWDENDYATDTLMDTVVIITDENTANDCWDDLKAAGAHVFQVQKAMDVPLPGTTNVFCRGRKKVFTCTVGADGGRCQFCGLHYSKSECRARDRKEVLVRRRILDWYINASHTSMTDTLAGYLSDPKQDPSIVLGPIDIEHFKRTGYARAFRQALSENAPSTSRPQEAHMSNKPTIVTSVTLARPSGNEEVIIADLKALIAEVERVGGDDSSVVALGHDNRTWNVTLSVKANEVEREVEVTDEERAALLLEYVTANKTRQAEIKSLLGL